MTPTRGDEASEAGGGPLTASDRDARITALRLEVDDARRRVALYRARAYALKPVRESRLRELERAAESAAARLRAALDG